jgi:hypothetical protein
MKKAALHAWALSGFCFYVCFNPNLVAAQPQTPLSLVAPKPPESVPNALSVPSGTLLTIEITDYVSTRTANRDDLFNFRLAEPLRLKDVVVMQEGTPGKGIVIEAAKPGMGGKPAKLVLAARYLEFEGRQIPVKGLNLGLDGKNNSGTTLALGILGGAVGGVAGLMVTGGHMEVNPGTRASVKLAVNFVPVLNADKQPQPAPQPQPAQRLQQ